MHRPVICHRLVFGIRPSPRVAALIGQYSVRLAAGAKRVRIDHLHVTLAILGDFPVFPRQIAEALIGVGSSIDARPFKIAVDLMVGSHRSVALRPRRKIPALNLLQKQIDAAMRNAGLPQQESYSFSPHLTLFYRDGQPFREAIDGFGWTAGEFVLVDSHVGRTRHDVLGRWPLRDSGGDQYRLL